MPKRYLLFLIPVVLGVFLYVPRMVAGPELRTRAYFAVQRNWMQHWPRSLRIFVSELMLVPVEPLVPVWFQVEPNIKMHLDPADSRPAYDPGIGRIRAGQYWHGERTPHRRRHLHRCRSGSRITTRSRRPPSWVPLDM